MPEITVENGDEELGSYIKKERRKEKIKRFKEGIVRFGKSTGRVAGNVGRAASRAIMATGRTIAPAAKSTGRFIGESAKKIQKNQSYRSGGFDFGIGNIGGGSRRSDLGFNIGYSGSKRSDMGIGGFGGSLDFSGLGGGSERTPRKVRHKQKVHKKQRRRQAYRIVFRNRPRRRRNQTHIIYVNR